MIKYEIGYNEYQKKYILYKIDYENFNIKGIFKADTRKECEEYRKELENDTK